MKHIDRRRGNTRQHLPPSPPTGNGIAIPASGTSPAGTGNGGAAISPEERRSMIELAAHCRAERRGFTGGSAEQDWLEAEAEIDRLLMR